MVERNYDETERECSAVVWAFSLFQLYIELQRVTVVADHEALSRSLRTKMTPDAWNDGDYAF